jgi:hypothetical protein
MRACDAVRRAAGPHRQVQPFLSGYGLGSRWISSSIDQICVRSRSDFTLRGELPTARCGPRITFVSSKGTTRKVDQVPNTEAFANLPQLGSGGRKETAQQSIPAEPLHPLMPALGVAIQPLEDPGQLGRDRGLSLAKEPTGIVDQLGIASQWKALNHAFTGRIQPAAVFDRTEPQRFFQIGRRLRASGTAVLGRFQLGGFTLSLDMISPPCRKACSKNSMAFRTDSDSTQWWILAARVSFRGANDLEF